MGEEANTTAVDTHVDSVHCQCSLLDDLACLVERKDLTSNTNERVLFEGETARRVLLAVASLIGVVDAENIQQKAIWVPGSQVCLLRDENRTLVRIRCGRGAFCGHGAVVVKGSPLHNFDTKRHAHTRGGVHQDLTDLTSSYRGGGRPRGGEQLGGADQAHDACVFVSMFC
jgi:hypothetical protein